jgi:hypothetical protein
MAPFDWIIRAALAVVEVVVSRVGFEADVP